MTISNLRRRKHDAIKRWNQEQRYELKSECGVATTFQGVSFVPIFVRHPNLRAEGLLFDAEMGDPRLATDILPRFPPSARHLYVRSTPLRRGV